MADLRVWPTDMAELGADSHRSCSVCVAVVVHFVHRYRFPVLPLLALKGREKARFSAAHLIISHQRSDLNKTFRPAASASHFYEA
jgi:hypothetical protein